ncbi:NADPH-dependent FMN reductase [Leucobacter sp. wl10]|uniref:NADPH-dependent FMN reductase n=1 Tax=Leucobacter sp. wl10 TaxID=2304677 RepID=UPI000E5B4253|nr:NADPH-dependent FMN reductase [Leucobacter sp. wl10]RGE20171.1 NAD(P)H-dependent oxidoreductase [Leucobacter sp. wl10]
MDSSPRIAVIVGSTRPGRISLDAATWVQATLNRQSELSYEIVDLAAIDLPFLDEPTPAAYGQYRHEHTIRWSELVSSYEGFVFVFPQYNWGYPGVLKNALDFLYREWHGKPATLFTWGIRGGARGAAQFHQIMLGLHMDPLSAHVEAVFTDSDTDHAGRLASAERTFATTRPTLHAIDREFRAQLVR